MTTMPKYDYSRVPAELFENVGRELFETAGPGQSQYVAACAAVQAAALVPERTRAELAEVLLAQMELSLEPGYTGGIEFGDVVGNKIRALVNEARTAPR